MSQIGISLEQQRKNRADYILKQINLILGQAAFLDVGQVHGTVAAGDDPRFAGLPTLLPAGVTFVFSNDPRFSQMTFCPPKGVLDVDTGNLVCDVANQSQVVVG